MRLRELMPCLRDFSETSCGRAWTGRPARGAVLGVDGNLPFGGEAREETHMPMVF